MGPGVVVVGLNYTLGNEMERDTILGQSSTDERARTGNSAHAILISCFPFKYILVRLWFDQAPKSQTDKAFGGSRRSRQAGVLRQEMFHNFGTQFSIKCNSRPAAKTFYIPNWQPM